MIDKPCPMPPEGTVIMHNGIAFTVTKNPIASNSNRTHPYCFSAGTVAARIYSKRTMRSSEWFYCVGSTWYSVDVLQAAMADALRVRAKEYERAKRLVLEYEAATTEKT